MEDKKNKAFEFKHLFKVLKYMKPYKALFYGGLSLTLLLALLGTARPILIKQTIDNYIIIPNAEKLLEYTFILIGLLLLETVFQFAYTYTANFLGQSIIRDIRTQLFKHLIRFKLTFFDKTPIGNMVTRAVSDVEVIADIFAEGILVIFGELLKISVMITAMFIFFDYQVVFISLAVIPFLYVATRWFQKNMKVSFQEVRNEVANLNAFVQERLTGMSIVQLFNREKVEYEKFQKINARHREANIKGIWYFSIFLPILDLLSAISIGLVVWYGGLKAIKGQEVSVGELTAIIMFVNMIFRPLRQLADRINTLQMGLVASERVLKLLDNEEDRENQEQGLEPELKGKIEFKEVSFAYKEDDYIIKNLSFSVKPGEKIAVVGATGAGKTTLISLLSKYYVHQKGNIFIDNEELKEIHSGYLRKNMGMVLQDVFLFSDTIYNNIALGEDLSRKDILDAAEEIGMKAFIDQLPNALDFQVQERGSSLSSGQRQLIAFLRVYLKNPKILILDEATSNIDSQTEQLIQAVLEKITKNRTSIIIAHRLSTIQNADKILVMDKGRVVEEGTHKELLAMNGYYNKLHEMQFKAVES